MSHTEITLRRLHEKLITEKSLNVNIKVVATAIEIIETEVKVQLVVIQTNMTAPIDIIMTANSRKDLDHAINAIIVYQKIEGAADHHFNDNHPSYIFNYYCN